MKRALLDDRIQIDEDGSYGVLQEFRERVPRGLIVYGRSLRRCSVFVESEHADYVREAEECKRSDYRGHRESFV